MSLTTVLPNSPDSSIVKGPALPNESVTAPAFITRPKVPSEQFESETKNVLASPFVEVTWQPVAVPTAGVKSSIVRPSTFSWNSTLNTFIGWFKVAASNVIVASGASASITIGLELISKTVATKVPLIFSVGSPVVTLNKYSYGALVGVVEMIVEINSNESVAVPLRTMSSSENALFDLRVTLNSIKFDLVGEFVRTSRFLVPRIGK